jgi:predicted small secreted protein
MTARSVYDDLRAIAAPGVETMTHISRIAAASLLAASMLALSACNTIQGFGRDVSRAGEAIEDASNNSSSNLDAPAEIHAAP